MDDMPFKSYAQELREEGVAIGEARGAVNENRSTLRVLLEGKFQTLPEDIVQKIEQADLETLRSAIASFPTLQSLEDLDL